MKMILRVNSAPLPVARSFSGSRSMSRSLLWSQTDAMPWHGEHFSADPSVIKMLEVYVS